MSASDLAQVIEQDHRALGAFVKGDAEPLKKLFSRRDDVTLANPYGPPAHGWNDVAETLERAASYYREGEATRFEHISEFATGGLAYIVEVERHRSKIGDADDILPFSLRVTTIFRREDEEWRIVHSHADPITARRPPGSVAWYGPHPVVQAAHRSGRRCGLRDDGMIRRVVQIDPMPLR